MLGALLPSCADLSAIDENRCGNGFIEAGEDCEDLSAAASKPGAPGNVATCNAPGTANQCRFHCETDAQCQTAPVSSGASGWRCGVDKVCRVPQGDDGGKGTFFTPASSLIAGVADNLFTGDFDGDGRKDLLSVGPAGFDLHYFTRDGVVAKTISIPSAPTRPAIGKLTATAADDFTVDVAQGVGVMLGQLGQTIDPTSYASLDVKKRYQMPNDSGAPDAMRLVIADIGAYEQTKDVPPVNLRVGPGPIALSASGGDLVLIDAAADPAMGDKVLLATFHGLATSALLGTIPVAFLAPGGDRQRFFLAFRGDSRLQVIDAGATDKAQIKSELKLPPNFEVHGAAFVADVNGDGLTDVLVGAASCGLLPKTCAFAEIELAYGDGAGHFYATPPVNGVWEAAAIGKMAPYLNVFPAGDPSPPPAKTDLDVRTIEAFLPLALGRLNNDADLDYVNALGIYVSNATDTLGCPPLPNGYCQAERSSGGGLWTEAKISDFNNNGRLDVAALSGGNAGIDFFNGTGTGVFNPFAIPTSGVPIGLAVGDFDGDFLPDLAFDSINPESDGVSHTLSIAFGHASGVPELPVSMGEITNLQQIVSGNLSLFANDAASDIVLVSGVPATFDSKGARMDAGRDWKIGLAQGNGYRQLQAPLIFFAKKTIDVAATPLASAIGLFDGDLASTGATGPHADVAVVVERLKPKVPDATTMSAEQYCDIPTALWLLPATGDAEIEPPADDSKAILISLSTTNPPVPERYLPVRDFVETVPVHLDGGSAESLLIAFPSYDTCVLPLSASGAHGELLLARFDADGTPHLTQLIKSVGANEFLIRVHVGDLDGDGIPDIAAVKAGLDLDAGVVVETHVVVLRGDGKGSFEPPLTVPIEGVPIDLALINTDGESDLELVVLSAYANPVDLGSELFVIDWDKAAKGAASPFKTLLPRSGGATDSTGGSVLDRPTSMAGGDFDGDGVDDLAVAVAGGTRLFKGISR
jgi:hypothetical protein